ncbi:MAG: MOSC domain-containing protein [Cellvibrionaceae bacterium]
MIEAIYVAANKRESLQNCDFANVIAYQGLAGDRYCRRSLSTKYNVSFMAVEQVERFNRRHETAITWSAARRNVMTRGIDLNALVGIEFRIGNVWFRGEELCQPCKLLARWYRDSGLNQRTVLTEMMARSGIRATALNDGVIEIGMPITVE